VSAAVAEGSEVRRALIGVVLGVVMGLLVRVFARRDDAKRSPS